jgi:hypothetical protein
MALEEVEYAECALQAMQMALDSSIPQHRSKWLRLAVLFRRLDELRGAARFDHAQNAQGTLQLASASRH